ncbi:MAG: integrase core domain-containing protein [Desulfobacteraceae bacterium]
MKGTRFRQERIIGILKEADCKTSTIGELCGKHGVSEQRFYSWRRKYDGLSVREARRLKDLEKALKRWLVKNGTDTIHIEPGKPWQNSFIESFNSKVRDEFFNIEVFYALAEAQVTAEIWRLEYNGIRSHRSLKYQTPEECWQGFFARPNSVTVEVPLPAQGRVGLSSFVLPAGCARLGHPPV